MKRRSKSSQTESLATLSDYSADGKGNILLAGSVSEEMLHKLAAVLITLGPTKELNIRLDTDGGDVDASIAIYDLLRDHNAHISMTVIGRAWSAGVILLQAADDRVMLPNATVMVHEGLLAEGAGGTYADSRATLEFDQQQADRYDTVLLSRIQEKNPRETRKLIQRWNRETKYMTAAEAVDWGLADRVKQPNHGNHL